MIAAWLWIKKHWEMTLISLGVFFAFLFGFFRGSKKKAEDKNATEILKREIKRREKESKVIIDSQQKEMDLKDAASKKHADTVREAREAYEKKKKELEEEREKREKKLGNSKKETDKILKDEYGIKEYKKKK